MPQPRIRVQIPVALNLSEAQVKSLNTVLKTHVASVRTTAQDEDLSSIPDTNIIIGSGRRRRTTKKSPKKPSKKSSKKK
jgi:hypothetical protein